MALLEFWESIFPMIISRLIDNLTEKNLNPKRQPGKGTLYRSTEGPVFTAEVAQTRKTQNICIPKDEMLQSPNKCVTMSEGQKKQAFLYPLRAHQQTS